ncbi:VWA domain-containing protein [bacterium]|nr:VWA domain-containing protein [bacterium]
MSFLTPLYLAGLIAIAGPILFHMIRRTPKGQVPFSTLMFLEPSPPKVTSRSRIEHWLLLLLRAAAVILLAMAFSRPFLRQAEDQLVASSGERVVILLDTSASMRRDSLWTDAVAECRKTIDALADDDTAALYTFNQSLQKELSIEDWQQLERGQAKALLLKRLDELMPGWGGTDIGEILPDAVSAAIETSEENKAAVATRIVLISDLQRGSRVDALQAVEWPETLTVDVRPVATKKRSNAGVQIVGDTRGDRGLRVRIENSLESTLDRFDVLISDAAAKSSLPPVAPAVVQASQATGSSEIQQVSLETTVSEPFARRGVLVPPGQSRIVRFDDVPDEWLGVEVSLTGDETSFDNRVWSARLQPAVVPVVYYGAGAMNDPESLRFYVEGALLPTPERTIDFVSADETLTEAALQTQGLIIVARELTPDEAQSIHSAVQRGSHVVSVGQSVVECRQAFELAGQSAPDVTEANVSNYAMLSDVDVTHPLLSAYADAKLANFTSLTIWKHRTIAGLDSDANDKTKISSLAKLDGRSPGIVELDADPGRVTLFTFGWFDDQSNFFRWSRFPPLLKELVDATPGRIETPTRLTVGQSVALSDFAGKLADKVKVTPPSESWSSSQDSAAEVPLTEPGIYRLKWDSENGTQDVRLAANLDPLESRTSPLGLDELIALGVPVSENSAPLSLEETRQLQARELESRQRFWQWIIFAALLLLLVESWLAGRLTTTAAPASSE